MTNNNELSDEYLKESAEYFQRAKEECLILGKKILTQDWAESTAIYWAAVGVIENSCKAYSIYRRKEKIKEVTLDLQWREEIIYINDEDLTKLFNSVLSFGTKAQDSSITKNEAENCLKDADNFLKKIIETIPTSDRIKIGMN